MHINQTPALINILFLLPILFLQVFEDDCILSQATDSGCPSESLLEDEGTAEKQNVDLPASSNHPKGKPTSLTWKSRFDQLLTKGLRSKRTINLSSASSSDPPSPIHHPPPPSSPTHEHLGLEWDPSVDIGRSVSRDDADSSYFSASTGKKMPHLTREYRLKKSKVAPWECRFVLSTGFFFLLQVWRGGATWVPLTLGLTSAPTSGTRRETWWVKV